VDHDDVVALRQHSAAWRLLRADSAPLIISFLDDVFSPAASAASPPAS
jgi:Protein of unknown function (DUF3375)